MFGGTASENLTGRTDRTAPPQTGQTGQTGLPTTAGQAEQSATSGQPPPQHGGREEHRDVDDGERRRKSRGRESRGCPASQNCYLSHTLNFTRNSRLSREVRHYCINTMGASVMEERPP